MKIKSIIEDYELNVPAIEVSVKSAKPNGQLNVECAATRNNIPAGSNLSPEISWSGIEGAVYAVCMFDYTENRTHMLITGLTENYLEKGKYKDTGIYIGPYPSSGTGAHGYRIEVFALKNTPDEVSYLHDKRNSYKQIVKSLDISDGGSGNILARGFALTHFEYGNK